VNGADASLRSPVAPLNRVAWILTTAVGLSAGTTVSTYLLAPLSPLLSRALGGLPFALLYGATIGLVLAGTQYVVVRRGTVALRPFLLSMALCAAVGYALAAVLGEVLGNLISPNVSVVISEGTIEGVAGAIIGFSIGGAQWTCLRERLPRRRAWMAASAIGGALGYSAAAAALELLEVPFLKAHLAPSYGAIMGLFLGAAQAAAGSIPGRPSLK
jgi:hypothetical protein